MFAHNIFKWTAALSTAFMMNACAHRTKSAEGFSAVESAPALQKTVHYTVLDFQSGKTNLTSAEQDKIKNLSRIAEKTGTVNEVRILAWADDLETREPKLAAERATKIRSLLKVELKSKAPVEIYNMSQNPQQFTELIQEQDAKRKVTFKNTEVASFGNGPKSSLAGNKASKAIVIIRYE